MKVQQKKRVLILDGQAVQTLIIAERLVKSGYEVHLFCDDLWSYGYHTKYAKKSILAPDIHERSIYKEFLLNYLHENKIDVLIPMTDESAYFLSMEKKALEPFVKFLMPDLETFERGYNKQKLMAVCAEFHYPHPLTLSLENDMEKASSFVYPSLIKPNHMTGGRGMTRVNSYKDFLRIYPTIRDKYGPCHLQELIPEGGRQLKVQIFIDKSGYVIASSVIHKLRYYPENGGSSCCNITIKDNALIELCASILRSIEWVGFADFDLIEDPRDKVIKVMELNPRIPACIKSAIKSGVDYATIIAESSLGIQHRNDYIYRPGWQLRHIGFEILWFIYSKKRLKTHPNWFKFVGKNISYQDFSWYDPLPFIFGTIGNIKKQLNPQFRKAKSGMR